MDPTGPMIHDMPLERDGMMYII